MTQRVMDQIADRRPVAGAGETVRQAPVAQRLGSRTMARDDVGQNLRGSGDATGQAHEEAVACFLGSARIVGAFAGNRHAMGMALAQAGAGDANELRLVAELLQRPAADIAHG